MMDWLLAKSAELDALARLIVLVGVPTGLVQFYLKARRERRDDDYGAYNAVDEKYLDFLRACFENPRLDVFDVPDADPVELTPEEKKKELILFTSLISIFERAYLVYKRQPKRLREAQWQGWQTYVTSFCRRRNFRDAWSLSGKTFDQGFQDYLEEIIRETAPGR